LLLVCVHLMKSSIKLNPKNANAKAGSNTQVRQDRVDSLSPQEEIGCILEKESHSQKDPHDKAEQGLKPMGLGTHTCHTPNPWV